MNYWILRDREPVKADLYTWAVWFQDADRYVALTEIGDGRFMYESEAEHILGVQRG